MKHYQKTIAVLPFINIGSNQEYEYFSDGITEEIINALAKIGTFKVTSRTSSFFFKNKNIPIPQIGKELGVSIILEGSIRLAQKRVRITAQLIQAEDDFHFWSETWDRTLDDIFEVQDEISLLIADKIREQFGHFELEEHLIDKKTDNLDAYEYSLQADYYKNRWNPNDIKIAIQLYEKAITLDPKQVEAHLGLADSYGFLGTTGFMPFEEAWGKVSQYTYQALKLDDRHSKVHYQLANLAFFIDCNYKKSLEEILQAIEINPNNAEAQQFTSFLFVIAGDMTNGKKHLELAIAINPLSEETQFFNAYFHYMKEDYHTSLQLLDDCIQKNEHNIPAHSVKVTCLIHLHQYDEALNYFDNVPQESIVQGEKIGYYAIASSLKNKEEKDSHIKKLQTLAKEPNGFTVDSFLFMLYGITGMYDEAFQWAQDALQKRSSLLLIRFADPLVKNSLKKDSRYKPLYEKIYHTEKTIPIKKVTKKALLNKDDTIRYTKELRSHIDKNKPYINENLTLRLLAEQINLHPNQLSWLLNEQFGKNFNEFINHYRIEMFKTLAKDPKNSHLSILGLAFESGFSSKTVFNTYFKKETGVTPKQFLNKNQ